jgi:hypothetical protein
MAFVQSIQNQDDENKQNQQQDGAAKPVSVSGSSGGDTGGGGISAGPAGQAQSAPAAAPGAPTKSGRFQNIQNYLNANKGYKQEQGGLAGQTYQNLKDQQEQQRNAIGGAAQQTAQQAQQASAQYDPSKVQSYLGNVLADPTKVASDENAYKQWQDYYAGAYKAPEQFDAQGKLLSQAQNFQQTANLAQNETGRMSLLQKLYGRAGYNAGQQNLDNLFMQTDPNQLQRLETGSKDLSNQLMSGYNASQQQAQEAVAKGKSLADQASAATKAALQQNIEQQQGVLQNKAAELQQQRDKEYNDIVNSVKQGKITLDMVSKLGMDPNLFRSGWVGPAIQTDAPVTQKVLDGAGLNFLDFINKAKDQVGIGNVATAQDAAKFQALAKLMGESNSSPLASYANVATKPLTNSANFDLSSFLNAYKDTNKALVNHNTLQIVDENGNPILERV